MAPIEMSQAPLNASPPERAAELVVGAAVWVLTGLVIAGVLARYVFGTSLVWGEEVARYMMVYITFLGALVPMFSGKLMAFSSEEAAPGRFALLGTLISLSASLIFYAGFLVSAVVLITVTRSQRTIATGFPISYVYAVLCVFAVAGLANVVLQVARLLRRVS